MINAHILYKDTRKKSARLSQSGLTLHITLPLGISLREEEKFVTFAKKELAIKLACREESKKLSKLALYLDKKYLKARNQTLLGKPLFSIKYVANQRKTRWGSCSKDRGGSFLSINLSHSLIKAPQFVINYVIIHELAHGEQMNHSIDFKIIADVSPYHYQAQAWLKDHRLGWSDDQFML